MTRKEEISKRLLEIGTTIEQSQKLIELGINRNTADMCWQNNIFPIGFNDVGWVYNVTRR